MTILLRMLPFAALLVGCSVNSDTESQVSELTSCRKTDRTGTYMATLTERSGTCGKMNPHLVSVNQDDGNATAGCTLHSDVWSSGDCKNERTFSCSEEVADRASWGGVGVVTSDSVIVTRQTTANGSRITGTLSIAITTPSGPPCRSIYDVVYERQ